MADLLQAYQTGAQLGLQRRSQDIQASQFDRNLEQNKVMQALHAQSEQLLNQERGLDIQLKVLAKQRELQILDAETKGGQILLDAGLAEGGMLNPEIYKSFSNLVKSVPGFLATRTGQALSANFSTAINFHKGEQQAIEAGLVSIQQTIRSQAGDTTTFGVPEKTRITQTEFDRALELGGFTPEERQQAYRKYVDKATAPPASSVLDPAEQARIALATENLIQRMRSGQLDERKFKLEILKELGKIDTDPLLASKPGEKAAQKAEYLRSLRAMGVTGDFTEPQGLRNSLTPSTNAPALKRLIFKNGQLVPAEP